MLVLWNLVVRNGNAAVALASRAGSIRLMCYISLVDLSCDWQCDQNRSICAQSFHVVMCVYISRLPRMCEWINPMPDSFFFRNCNASNFADLRDCINVSFVMFASWRTQWTIPYCFFRKCVALVSQQGLAKGGYFRIAFILILSFLTFLFPFYFFFI